MAVRINGLKPRRQSNRRKAYNRLVNEMTPLLIKMQAKGYISAGQIAEALQNTSVRTAKGKPFAESVIFGMLKRSEELGFSIVRRSRSEAASARPSKPRRPRYT